MEQRLQDVVPQRARGSGCPGSRSLIAGPGLLEKTLSWAKISRLLSRGLAAPSTSRGLTCPTLPRTLPRGQPWALLLKEPAHDSIPHLPHRPHCLPPAYSFPRNFFSFFFLFLSWNFFVLILSCHFFFIVKIRNPLPA